MKPNNYNMKRLIALSMIAFMVLLVMPTSAKVYPAYSGANEVEYNLTPLNMAKVTKAEIQAWKEQYAQIYEVESDGKVGYIFDPTCKLSVMKMITTAAQKGGSVTMTEAVLNNCWLGGDEEIRKDDSHILGLVEQIDELIDIPEYGIEFNGDHAVVTVLGKSCKLRLAQRGDIKYAEGRNKKNDPFATSIYLLERLAIDSLDSFKNDNRAYMGLLLAVSEVQDSKYKVIKKL